MSLERKWEVIIDKNCDAETFFKVADILELKLNLTFTNKLNDLGSYYWDFNYKDVELVLHYNIYMGISVFPNALEKATESENQKVLEVSDLIQRELS